jgi:hypothetical protein
VIVRKGRIFGFAVGAVLLASFALTKACVGERDGGKGSANSSANSSKKGPASRPGSPPTHGPAPVPSIAASAVTEVARNDAGAARVVFFSPWGGSDKTQVGRERLAEGNPTAPMSLARDAKGRVYVLDQVNGRVVRYGADGKPEGASDMKLLAAQDLAVGNDGSMAVLDRLSDKTIALYDEGGALRGQLPLEGEGVDDPGLLTGVFVDGSDVYVEREHGPLVKIGDTSGKPAEPRSEIPGRPSRDGLSYLNAGIINKREGRAYVSSIERATGEHRFTRELRLRAPLRAILLLDSDKAGTIYFATEIEQESGGEAVLLTCLDPLSGIPTGSVVLPANTMPEETFRDLTVLDEGGVMYALRSEKGVSYLHYDCN